MAILMVFRAMNDRRKIGADLSESKAVSATERAIMNYEL
jgi:pyruvate/oxaloacetate carboxyltransferase